jgi:hypothetical protein
VETWLCPAKTAQGLYRSQTPVDSKMMLSINGNLRHNVHPRAARAQAECLRYPSARDIQSFV